MPRSQNPANCDQEYLTKITLALNKIKAKLPTNTGYRPDRHFEYLSNNTKSIKMETLSGIIPFKQQYKYFNPTAYLSAVLYRLNEGIVYNSNVLARQMQPSQLGYQGYIRLITTQRIVPCRGSEVNITLFSRASLDHQIDRMLEGDTKIGDANRKSDSIIGMLLFLQCLKQAERLQAQTQTNKLARLSSTHRTWNNMNPKRMHGPTRYTQYAPQTTQQSLPIKHNKIADRYYYLNEQINKNNTSQPLNVRLDQNTYPYGYYDQYPRPRKSMITFGSQHQYNSRSRPVSGTEYYQPNGVNSQKHQFMRTMDTKYSNNPEQESPIMQGSKQFENDNRSKSAYPFLSRFSSNANIWKNIAERNWDYKTQYLKRSGHDSTAFIYEQNMMDKSNYTRMPKSPRQASRPMNKIDKSGYYTK